MRDIEFNARNGRSAALHIKQVRRHALWVGIGLDALCLAVAVLAGLIVRRQVHRYGDLLESYTRVVEERSGELEFFAGRVAHDIVNPVGAAQIAVHLAVRHGAPDVQTRKLLDRADRSLNRAQAIIDGLLRFARAGAKPNPGSVTDVPHVVEDVMRALAESDDATGITMRWDAAPCAAACDAGVLTSILSNLVHNAAKYLGDGPERRIEVRARVDGTNVHFEVEDSGSGLPPDLVGRVFEPYVRGAGQAKPGLGLGLATVKRLSEGHGGRVGVDSEPGHGCTFWFELPLAGQAARGAAASA
jgi:signal transduction histidine kinase